MDLECAKVLISRHAFEQMFARSIQPAAIRSVIASGEVIAEYPQDRPFPSALMLGHVDGTPIHVVVARDASTGQCVVVTAYAPDPALWEIDFRTRRRQ